MGDLTPAAGAMGDLTPPLMGDLTPPLGYNFAGAALADHHNRTAPMAATSLLALLDDIATVLDDIAMMTKVAARKTAGVLGDDLALNAQQVAGVRADRELPVVWAVAKGSFRNKLILVPAALAAGALVPWIVLPLLMLGGAYLCYEGFEKLAHAVLPSTEEDDQHRAELTEALKAPEADLVAFEQTRIRGAIRTDFVLSAEIIVIALGIVAGASFAIQAAVVTGIAIMMTVGVYGLVAAIVKLDDAGLYLSRRQGTGFAATIARPLGSALLATAPWLMKALSVVGTAAMFLVGGGILVHGLPAAAHIFHDLTHTAAALPGLGSILGPLTPLLLDGLAGIVAGALVLGVVTVTGKLWQKLRPVTG